MYGAATPNRLEMVLAVKKWTSYNFLKRFSISKDIKIALLVQEIRQFY